MTKPTDVRFGWLMAFWTDWFVCDGVHDGQNVSLHQSIRASGVTADFHYEEEVNLTFHLQAAMRVIRKCGSDIKETLRSCPRRCGIARKQKGKGDNKKWVGRNSRAAANEDALKEHLHSVFEAMMPVCTLARTSLPKSEASAAGVSNSRARGFLGANQEHPVVQKFFQGHLKCCRKTTARCERP